MSSEQNGYDQGEIMGQSRVARKLKQRAEMRKETWSWIRWLGITLVVTLLIRGFVFEPVRVDGPSMESTLITDEIIAVSKAHYRLGTPQRGDVVVCHFLDDTANYVKRVVGLPGEVVELRNSILHINGQPIDEPYLDKPNAHDFGPVIVPENAYFVMGDNRGNSTDSRNQVIGAIPRSRLVGKAMAIMWPFSNIGVVRH